MYIFVEALTGLTLRLKVEPDDLIQSIKYKIMVCEDLPIDEQHLIFQETELENKKSIKDCNIGPGNTLRLIMKMKGGPLSPDLSYENVFSESEDSPLMNNISDYLAIMLFENGDYKFFPIFGLEKQNPNLKQTKDDLNDEDIFSHMDESLSEQKITILKLKMDYAKLNKRLSSLNLQSNNKDKISNITNEVQKSQNKQTNKSLCRSISLDSHPTTLVSGVPKLLNKTSYYNTQTSQRSPSLGIHRTMSVLDSVKFEKFLNTLPHIQDKDKNNETLRKYSQSFEKRKNLSQSRLKLPPLNELEEIKKPSTLKRICPICSKKLTLTNEFTCRCGGLFCIKHRYPEEHKCTFDFKSFGQLELIKCNPVIKATKITKI